VGSAARGAVTVPEADLPRGPAITTRTIDPAIDTTEHTNTETQQRTTA
jgi:hypothetical protein